MRDSKRIVYISIAAVGLAAVVTQIVFMRELLIAFYGNELSTAFMLAGWLTAGALGSALFGRFTARIAQRGAVFTALLLLAAAALPSSLWAIRSIKGALGLNPGEIVAVFPMIMASFAVLAPVCILTGSVFALSCAIVGGDGRVRGSAIGKVYALESAGAMAGGAAASFVLLKYLGSVQIIASASFLLTACALMAGRSLIPAGRRARAVMLFAAASALALHGAAAVSGAWDRFDRSTLRRQWQGYELAGSRSSIYGNVAVTRHRSQYSFFSNGLHLYTVPDRQACEESVDFALLEHPDPRRVLIIGGGAAGLVAEALKHPVERVDYVELDPLIVRMAVEHLPRDYILPLEDSRAGLRYDDGRRYIESVSGVYDAVIIALGDPYTAQLNRFYTAEFFDAARRSMRPGGVISFALTASESYLGRDARRFLSSVYATLGTAFADIKVLPGETAIFLASAREGALTRGYRTIVERAARRRIDLMYVREYYLASRLADDRTEAIDRALRDPAATINRDFRPISYYYDMVFWAARFKGSLFARVMRSMQPQAVWAVVGATAGLVLICGSAGPAAGRAGRSALVCIAVNGFSQIVFQVVALLAFQIVYGYMFYKLGLIITACMAGLAAGGWAGTRFIESGARARSMITAAQLLLAAIGVILPELLVWTRGPGGPFASWAGPNIVFTAVPLLCGACGGLIFALAGSMLLAKGREAGAGGGLAYGLDLAGACAGALLAGTLFIPMLGIPNTCYAVAIVNISAAAVLGAALRRYRSGAVP